MSLKKYLIEGEESPDQQWERIKKECSRYLKECNNKPFIRRSDAVVKPYWMLERKTREDRHSLSDSDKDVISDFLKTYHHIDRYKNAVIGTSPENRATPTMLGKPYILLIPGDYEYTYVKAYDLNLRDSRNPFFFADSAIRAILGPDEFHMTFSWFGKGWEINAPSYVRIDKESVDQLAKYETQQEMIAAYSKQFVTNRNMKEAYEKNYEIWFKTPKYYLCDMKYWNELEKTL